jgi:curli biogenesis system outer membrane secretion channel CsgG
VDKGKSKTIKVLNGDYTIVVAQGGSAPKPSTFKEVLNGERITIVARETSTDYQVAESDRSIESRVLIVSGQDSSRSRVNMAALDELVGYLFEDMNPRLIAGRNLVMLPMNHNQGVDGNTADYLTDQLTMSFLNANKYEVLERARIDIILTEQKFQMSGNVDNDTAVRAGKILGAHIILVANVEGSGASRRIVLRALDVSNGRVLGMSMEQF